MSESIEEAINRERQQTIKKALVVSSLGMAALAAAVWMLFQPAPSPVPDIQQDLESRCRAEGSARGASVTLDGDLLRMALPVERDGAKGVLYRSSLIISRCEGYRLLTYCLGRECEDGAHSMTLGPGVVR